MFDIKIGTLISSKQALTAIPKLNPYGFETYELQLYRDQSEKDIEEFALQVKDVLDGREVSALSFYENPLMNDVDYEQLQIIIKNAHKFNCRTVCIFSGADPERPVDQVIPYFKKRYTPIVKLAEDMGVRIGFENCSCGGTWYCNRNLAYAPESWELIFDAIDSPNLGLEWEPAHQVRELIDPIQNLRKWAKKVVHVHGKDATVAWDVIREYGIRGIHQFSWDRTPGFGDTNWADVFTILLQNGFEGSADIEGFHDPVHYDDMEWSAQVTALEYLKRCRGGVNYVAGPEEIRGFQGKRKK